MFSFLMEKCIKFINEKMIQSKDNFCSTGVFELLLNYSWNPEWINGNIIYGNNICRAYYAFTRLTLLNNIVKKIPTTTKQTIQIYYL